MRTIALPKHKPLTVVCRYYVSRGRTSDDAVNTGFERGVRVCRSQGRGLAV